MSCRAFDDGVYLHQVVHRGDAGLTRYLDLPEAFAAAVPKAATRGSTACTSTCRSFAKS